jgi:hypothetical protein
MSSEAAIVWEVTSAYLVTIYDFGIDVLVVSAFSIAPIPTRYDGLIWIL